MCGIVGFVNCGNEFSLSEASSVIAHRGPDDNGIAWFPDKNSGLAHRRLSIIDLSPSGHQPMACDDKILWIIFNGEIYNYLEIRQVLISKGFHFNSKSDTEVVLKAYQYWGVKSLQKLNGMFAFAIYNSQTGEMFAARDRLGIKPLYYHQTQDGLIIASEIKSILHSGLYTREVDLFALHTPVHYQVGPNTGFKNVYKLGPGKYFTFIQGNLNISTYWSIKPDEQLVALPDAIDSLDEILKDSVKLQMIADVPVGLLLSGGVDSSLIGALMSRQTNKTIHSFTIKFNNSDLKKQGNANDSYYARTIAEKFQFNHHEILIEPDIINLLPEIIWHLDEPLADPAAINTFLICKAARKMGIIVLLNGMGSDEVFSGYRAHLACIKADGYQNIFPKFVQKMVSNIARELPEASKTINYKYIRWFKRFIEIASLPRFERSLAIKNSSLTEKNFDKYYLHSPVAYNETIYYRREKELFDLYNVEYLTHLCLNDTLIYMPDHNLTYTDKASMAASVECRPPLIDHRIVEYMFNLAPELRLHGNIQKYLLKKVSEKYLPSEIIYRPKAPFSAPMRSWLKNELREMIGDVLSDSALMRRGIYNPLFVRRLIDRNQKGLDDNSQLIYRLLSNELWFRTFFG